jgi:hypothetical protein
MTAQPTHGPANDVKAPLTHEPATGATPSRAKGQRSRRSQGEVENPDYAAFAARIIRAPIRSTPASARLIAPPFPPNRLSITRS